MRRIHYYVVTYPLPVRSEIGENGQFSIVGLRVAAVYSRDVARDAVALYQRRGKLAVIKTVTEIREMVAGMSNFEFRLFIKAARDRCAELNRELSEKQSPDELEGRRFCYAVSFPMPEMRENGVGNPERGCFYGMRLVDGLIVRAFLHRSVARQWVESQQRLGRFSVACPLAVVRRYMAGMPRGEFAEYMKGVRYLAARSSLQGARDSRTRGGK